MLCDGPCGRAYHEKCTVPNFVAEELNEDADWLCPACQTKARPQPLFYSSQPRPGLNKP